MARILVTLDDNVPEYMSGIIRCGSVQSFDDEGNLLKDHQELIDNTEYHSEAGLRKDIARRLGVSPDDIDIE